MLTSIMIGNKISEARKAKNYSQAQLAQQLSVSSQAVGKWERGESMPDIIMFNRLAEVLGVDLNYFSESFPSGTAGQSTAETEIKQSAELAPESPIEKPKWNMSSGNWVDSDFSGLKNLHEKFSSSNMQRCLFVGSNLSGLLLNSNNVDGCDFSNSNLDRSHFRSSNIINDLFKKCSLKEAEFSSSQMKACDFTGADLTGATFKTSSLLKSTMTNTVLNRTTFRAMQISDTEFDGKLTDCSFDNCVFARVIFRNATLTNTFFKNKSLKRIQFIDCKTDNITYAFLKNGKADLTGVTLITP